MRALVGEDNPKMVVTRSEILDLVWRSVHAHRLGPQPVVGRE